MLLLLAASSGCNSVHLHFGGKYYVGEDEEQDGPPEKPEKSIHVEISREN